MRQTLRSCMPSCMRTSRLVPRPIRARGSPSRPAPLRRRTRSPSRGMTLPFSPWWNWTAASWRARHCCGPSTCITGWLISGCRCGPLSGAAVWARTLSGAVRLRFHHPRPAPVASRHPGQQYSDDTGCLAGRVRAGGQAPPLGVGQRGFRRRGDPRDARHRLGRGRTRANGRGRGRRQPRLTARGHPALDRRGSWTAQLDRCSIKQKRKNDQTVVPPGGGTVEDNGHPDKSIWGESSLHQTRGCSTTSSAPCKLSTT